MNYDENSVPVPYMREAARLYIDYGVHPGGFLTAVLENNFVRAVGSADETNLRFIRDWALWAYNDIPSACWGTVEKVDAWITKKGLLGGEAHAAQDPTA